MDALRDMCEAANRADRMGKLPEAVQEDINNQIKNTK